MHQFGTNTKKRYTYLFLFCLVLLVLCSIFLAFQFAYILPNWRSMSILLPGILFLSSFFYIVWYISPGLDYKNHFGKALFAVIACFSVIGISASLIANTDKIRDMRHFKEANIRDAKSKEFAVVKALGKDNNILIRLGDTKSSWAISRLNLPNSSGASITLENAHCKLNYNDESIRDVHAALAEHIPSQNAEIDIPKLTIMVHELSHCLDIKRDFVTYNLHRVNPEKPQDIIIGTHAIAPQYRSIVKPDDLETYYDAFAKSVLWIEVFSDVYSIGYLYIQHPEYAVAINKGLIDFRTKNAYFDPNHNTGCWLATIENSVKPTKMSELIAWTDRIRSSQICSFAK